MKCYLCESEHKVVFTCREPDTYQKLVGKTSGKMWLRCSQCGLYEQVNSNSGDELRAIYGKYRDLDMRGESVEDAFTRIKEIPWEESENVYRFRMFKRWFPETCKILDVGSGLGVFPELLDSNGHSVVCVEPNDDSRGFIQLMNMRCVPDISDVKELFDVVTLVHVLEHFRHPLELLQQVNERLVAGGRLFIEVPDTKEFSYLPKWHDEFNSLHYFFYNVSTMYKLLKLAGFDITDAHRVFHQSRKLTRLMIVAKRGG